MNGLVENKVKNVFVEFLEGMISEDDIIEILARYSDASVDKLNLIKVYIQDVLSLHGLTMFSSDNFMLKVRLESRRLKHEKKRL